MVQNAIKMLSEAPRSKLENPYTIHFHRGVWPEEPYEVNFFKKTLKKNLITNGSENLILENPDFFSFGLFGCFGVGGSIRLVKLVCLLLARAPQVPYTA